MAESDFIVYRKISIWSSIIALTVGSTVIAGWIINMPILTSLNPNWVTMKVNTALGFVLSGGAVLFLLAADKSFPNTFRWLARTFALALFLMGGLTAIEYAFGIDLHIDELFLKQKAAPLDLAPPGRMSPFTSMMQVNFAIVLGLLSNTRKNDFTMAIAQVGAFIGGAIGLLAFFGYLLNAKALYAVGHSTAIAAHTALCFILISLSILFLYPQAALMRVFTSLTKTGHILRRFVPLALLIPACVGWLRLVAHHMDLVDLETGLALVVTCWVITWEMGIFWISRKFQEVEIMLSEREEQMRGQAELLNLTQDAILVRDLNGKITFWNSGAEKMYGYSQLEAMGKISHELLKTQFPIKVKDIERRVVDTNKWEGELTHYTKDLQPIVVASRWSAKHNERGEPDSFLEINSDISATKEAEARVSEFYSTVSHELRTPLTSIKGSFSLLSGGRIGELSEQAKQLVNIGLSETERLIRLINNILDIKKIEAGKFELAIENIEPKQFVEETILSITSFAEQYNVQLIAQVDDNNMIKGDKDCLIQVLTNLISNAVKFSDAGQFVTVITSRHNNAIRFSIVDTGPGIDARNVPKLFRMFQQSDASNHPKGGTGLGLAVCKSLVEQHRGSIGIDTEVGKGSTFWFEIPCA